MEKKLEEYRAKKRREEKINDLKMNVKHLFFKEKLVRRSPIYSFLFLQIKFVVDTIDVRNC